MLGGTKVSLPSEFSPSFPETCVCCGANSPTAQIRLADFKSDLTWAKWGSLRRFLAKAPICRRCKDRVYLRQLLILAATVAICFLAYWLLQPLVAQINSPMLRRFVMIGALLLCCAPVWVWEALRPPPFDVTMRDGMIDYEFRDVDIAIQFAFANRQAAGIMLNGEAIDLQGMINAKFLELLSGGEE